MIFILSKILPLLVLPLGLVLILLLLGHFFRKKWAVISAISILYFFSLGIISDSLWRFIEAPWERKDISSLPRANAIVVLSGSLHPSPGKAKINEWNDPDRFLAGVKIYKFGKASTLIFTGGINPLIPGFPPESEFYLEEAKSLGVPESAIKLTPPVINTAEEALAIKNIIPINRYGKRKKIILITSAFHMQRAKKVFEREGLSIIPYPVDFKRVGAWAGESWKNPIKWMPSANSLVKSSNALREILGRIVYRTW